MHPALSLFYILLAVAGGLFAIGLSAGALWLGYLFILGSGKR